MLIGIYQCFPAVINFHQLYQGPQNETGLWYCSKDCTCIYVYTCIILILTGTNPFMNHLYRRETVPVYRLLLTIDHALVMHGKFRRNTGQEHVYHLSQFFFFSFK